MQLANNTDGPQRSVLRMPPSALIVVMVVIVAALSTEPHVLAAVHALIEEVVYFLT
jgi:hypothetical protein